MATLFPFSFFSWLGDWERVVLIGLAIIVLFFRLGWKRDVGLLVLTVAGAKLLSILFKHFFAAPRPDPVLWLTDASGFSFPSGHATVAMALYGTLGLILWKRLPRKWMRYGATFLMALLVVGIGWSRVALGVHWPRDVLAGWLLGLFTLFLVTGIRGR